ESPDDTAQSDSGATDNGAAPGGTLTIGLSREILTLDVPNYVGTSDLAAAVPSLFEPLVEIDDNGEYQPMLATSWEQVDDVTYTFELREGVTFHDGTPFNAEAVQKYFERAIESARGSRFYDKIASIETDGDHSIT